MWDTQCVSPSPVLLQGPAYGSAQEKNPLPPSSHLSQLVESLQICRTGWPVAEGQPVRYLLFFSSVLCRAAYFRSRLMISKTNRISLSSS